MAHAYKNYKQLRQTGQFSRRSIIKGIAAAAILSYVSPDSVARAAVVTAALGSNIILGRPTKTSVALSYLSAQAGAVYVEYGYAANALKSKTKATSVTAGMPLVIELTGLKAATRVYYRLRLAATGKSTYTAGSTNSFVTARVSGASFSFAVQGDSHPERAGKMFNSDLYFQTMRNVASQKPDFFVMLGDDFSIDPLIEKSNATATSVDNIYATQRNWLSVLGASVPIFHVNVNNEQAAA
jgi:phosphodiesterase/alkaline phosphatase D-like protein